MRSLARLGLSLLLLVSIGACSSEPPAPPTSGPSADDYAAIRKMDAQFRDLILAKDWPNLEKLYADNAVLMPPNARQVMGVKAIAEYYSSAGITVHEYTTNVDAIGGS